MRKSYWEGFLLWAFLALLLVGCMAPEPQIIIQTQVMEHEATREVVVVKEVTRLVREVITATPLQVSPTPTPAPTIRLCFSPGFCVQEGAVAYQRLAEALAGRTGFGFELVPAEGDEQVMQALCAGRADVAWMSISAYLMAHELCLAEARFSALRQGSGRIAQIMVQSDQARQARGLAPIKSLGDLKGKVFAFTDPHSATGYFFPKALLLDAGGEPSEEMFVGGDSQAVLVVYTGEADAAASYWVPPQADGTLGDARASLLNAYPDAAQVVKIIRLSDPIPYEPLVFRRELPVEAQDKLLAAFIGLAESKEGLSLLSGLCSVTGLVPASDRDYEPVRQMARSLGLDYEQLAQMR